MHRPRCRSTTASHYPQAGNLQFSEVTVDQTTGAVTLRAIFPNPNGILLPGMFVRATIIEGVEQSAILAPQQGVSHNEKGDPTALVVDAKGRRAAALAQDVARHRRQMAGDGRPEARRQADRRGPAEGRCRTRRCTRARIVRKDRAKVPDGPVAVLHRPAGLRLGDRDRDRADGRARDPAPCRSRSIPPSRRPR